MQNGLQGRSIERTLVRFETTFLSYSNKIKVFRLPENSVTVHRSSCLGAGSFGDVFKGTYKNRDVAVKVFRKFVWGEADEKNQEKFKEIMKEFKLMLAVKHNNTIRVYGFILYEGCLGLVMEYANGGTLKDLISNPDFRRNVGLQYSILLNVAEGLRHIHINKIMHRDIKPENILICQYPNGSIVAKITDLGEGRFVEATGSFTDGRGTFKYMDPQTIKGAYNASCDFYSYCCVAYEVLTGDCLPNISLGELFKLVQNRRPEFPDSIPSELKSVLTSGFEEDLEKRADWYDTIEAISKT